MQDVKNGHKRGPKYKGEKEKETIIKITHVLEKNIPQERNIFQRA
jgi:hypothetical protein